MSRFFRDDPTADSASSGSSDDGDDREDNADLDQSPSRLDDTSNVSKAVVQFNEATSLRSETYQRDILLHALLEERCLRQTQDEFKDEQSSERVQLIASRRYQYLSQQLARLGLSSPGLDADLLSSTRRGVRDGLDVLLKGHHESSLPGRNARGTWLEDSQHQLQSVDLVANGLQIMHRTVQQPRLFLDDSRMAMITSYGRNSGYPSSALLNDTRYRRDFEEVSLLGRGGFGVVYHCRHRWDRLSYAIKRIPLSTNRLKKVQQRGQAEIDEMLLELTTLARLDHPNVVRYFGGWVELSNFEQSTMSPMLTDPDLHSASRTPTASVQTANAEGADFIMFEHSTPEASSSAAGADASQPSEADSESIFRVSTHATVSDEDVESISRSSTDELELSTLSTHMNNSPVCLALHIQMGLYPLTLADILADQTSRHCFHIEPAARLLSSLIDGVDYLHCQGVVHRDLKPANIFLTNQNATDTVYCRQCHDQDHRSTAYSLRIGDFGLVTAIAHQQLDEDVSPVGTEIYRPSIAHYKADLRALDWYAVGVIAFELIWPFSTRMERYETLSSLRLGAYPHDFSARFANASVQITELIESLLRSEHGVDVEGLRRKLTKIYAQ